MANTKKHWEKVYSKNKPTEVGWYQREPSLSLSLIRETKLANDAPIIDVGGGCSSLVDCLCDDGYTNITVLDISEKALAQSQDRLGEKASRVKWCEEDITHFRSPHRFSLWHDRAVFHFLTNKSDRHEYVNVLKQTLEPNGHLIIAAFAIGGPKKCSGLKIVQYDAKKMLSELGEGFELVNEKDEIHITPAKTEQKFIYFQFIRKSDI
ncbi:methyltransferase domain-containing protein [bacterium]|nr:methyltransferase domain-containing protein [bacterium]